MNDKTVKEYKIESKTEATLTIQDQGKSKIIHVRYLPKNLAFGTTLKDHKEALELLKSELEKGQKVAVNLMSSKGFIPIKGRAGHYRCDGLLIRVDKSGGKTVVLIHSNAGIESPN